MSDVPVLMAELNKTLDALSGLLEETKGCGTRMLVIDASIKIAYMQLSLVRYGTGVKLPGEPPVD